MMVRSIVIAAAVLGLGLAAISDVEARPRGGPSPQVSPQPGKSMMAPSSRSHLGKGLTASPPPGKGTISPASRPKSKGRYDRLPRPWAYHCRGYDPATGRRICRIYRAP
jgi:hypothetical protein